mmetsp:Transcript_58170/g.119002  ORF Transcript_58170/g.119002 Transcript_58170/m.119002 type:complete len:371 (+) Transcript_58170:43-1155(+)
MTQNPFRAYAKMADSSSKFGNVDGHFVVTEKVHGAHFCVVIDLQCGGTVRFAKRSEILAPEENFYGYLDSNIPKQCQNVSPEIVRQIAGLAERNQLAGHRFQDVQRIRVHGELFGGKYPGIASPTSVHGPVQNGVWYSNKMEFFAYDIAIEVCKPDTDGAAQKIERYLDYKDFRSVCLSSGLQCVHHIFIGTFQQCLDVNPEFQSRIAEILGLPPLPDNLAEGLVIKACKEDSNIYGNNTTRRIMKRKIARFSEKQYSMSRQEFLASTKHKARDTAVEATSALEIEALMYEGLACVTEARYHAVVSKLGPEIVADAVIDAYVKDVIEDLGEEDREMFCRLDSGAQRDIEDKVREAIRDLVPANSDGTFAA